MRERIYDISKKINIKCSEINLKFNNRDILIVITLYTVVLLY